jgi:hypothetical protein
VFSALRIRHAIVGGIASNLRGRPSQHVRRGRGRRFGFGRRRPLGSGPFAPRDIGPRQRISGTLSGSGAPFRSSIPVQNTGSLRRESMRTSNGGRSGRGVESDSAEPSSTSTPRGTSSSRSWSSASTRISWTPRPCTSGNADTWISRGLLSGRRPSASYGSGRRSASEPTPSLKRWGEVGPERRTRDGPEAGRCSRWCGTARLCPSIRHTVVQ